MPQSPDIGQNSDRGVSDFRISGQSLIKENCYNFRTSDDIDMKRQKKFNDNVMPENVDVIVTFRLFGQFGAVWRPDSGHRVCKTFFFSNSNPLSYKN